MHKLAAMPIPKPTKLIIADGNYLIRQGLRLIFQGNKELEIIGETGSFESIFDLVRDQDPDVIIIGLNTPGASAMDVIDRLLHMFPKKKVLVIDTIEDKQETIQILQLGVHGYILRQCDAQEIMEAIKAITANKNFFCSNVLQFNKDLEGGVQGRLSMREVEILKLIAEGLTNNEIADKIFLSAHTVATHRKNLMKKFQAKNNVDLVISAIKESIIVP